MGQNFTLLFPPAAKFTEKELPDQSGKVFIVTGASTGVGQELAQILYSSNAKVYIAARNEENGLKAIEEIKKNFPDSKGELVFLHLDLGDLDSIKKSADEFLAKETTLDVLWNNAGVMVPPQGSKTKQGYELQIGTNCLGPFLFTKYLTPILIKTAKVSPPGSVRTVWLSSSAVDFAPTHGVELDNLDYKTDKLAWVKYGVSKVGNYYYATEYAKKFKGDGILSVSLNPGNLKTPLQRHMPWWQKLVLDRVLHDPINGAYTELFGGLSPDIDAENSGCWIQPFGRIMSIRQDLLAGSKSESEGGTGIAEKFWAWSEEQVKSYA